MFVVGLFLVLLGFVALIFMALYVSRGLENGPRWLAANDLVLEMAILLPAVGGAIMAFAQPKGGYVLMGSSVLSSSLSSRSISPPLPETLRPVQTTFSRDRRLERRAGRDRGGPHRYRRALSMVRGVRRLYLSARGPRTLRGAPYV